jgi:hypothetical protein
MTLNEMKKKVLALIEEIDDKQESLTNDPDIEAKIPYVINQIQYELARVKKIPDYVEKEVKENELVRFSDITTENKIYQIDVVKGIKYEYKAQGTILKCLEDGIAEIEYFKYPKRIDETTPDTYELELSDDVLEVMPYGVAADLLKNDVSNAYGNVYAQRYEQMKSQLDIRYNTDSIEIVEGVI